MHDRIITSPTVPLPQHLPHDEETPTFEDELVLSAIAVRVTVMPDLTTTIATENMLGPLTQLCDVIDGDELDALIDICQRARFARNRVRLSLELSGSGRVA